VGAWCRCMALSTAKRHRTIPSDLITSYPIPLSAARSAATFRSNEVGRDFRTVIAPLLHHMLLLKR